MDRVKAWFTPQMVVAVVAAVFTGVGALAACVQLAEGHGYYAGWLWGPLQSLRGRAIHLLVVALLLGIWSAVWKWRGALALWPRERYVRALVWLSRPVRDELAQILCLEIAPEEYTREESLGLLIATIYEVTDADVLLMLELILRQYDEKRDLPVVITLDDIRSKTWISHTDDGSLRAAAMNCDELVQYDLLEHCDLDLSAMQLEAWLPPELTQSGCAEAMLHAVQVELFKREVPIRR